LLPASFCRYPRTKYGILIGTREFVSGVSCDRNENQRRSRARKLAVSEPRAATGARRFDDSEGRTARGLAIGAMQAMNGFWRPDADLHS
jgi:hypothetical protein